MSNTISISAEDWDKVLAELKKLRAEIGRLKKRMQKLELKEDNRSYAEWEESMGDDL